MRWTALVLCVVLNAYEAPAQSRRRPSKEAAEESKPRVERRDRKTVTPAEGRVVFVTSEQAYLDRGRANGLPVGQGVELVLSRGRTRSLCRVERVAENTATCIGEGVQVGDRFDLGSPVREDKAHPLPPPASESELRRRHTTLRAKPPSPVEYDGGKRLLALPVGGTFFLQDAFWTTQPGGSVFRQERIDVSLRSDMLPFGFRAFSDFRVLVWSRRPADSRQSRTQTSLQVSRAEVVRRLDEGGLTLAIGRTWPTAAPGAVMIDGINMGWVTEDHRREFGLYSGYLPNALNLHLQTQQSTAGAYFMQHWRGKGAGEPMARFESRLAWVGKEWAPSRLELETAIHASSRRSSANLQILGGLAGADAPTLDGVRLDARTRPFEPVTLHAGARYQREPLGDVIELGDPTRGARSLTVDTAVSLDAGKYLSLMTFARGVRDLETVLQQLQFGGEAAWLHGFGAGSRLSVGHQEERGWLPGRTAHLQLIIHPWRVSTVIARMTVSQLIQPQAASQIEAGMYLSAQVRLGRAFWLRLTALARADVKGALPPRPWGFHVTGNLGGTF